MVTRFHANDTIILCDYFIPLLLRCMPALVILAAFPELPQRSTVYSKDIPKSEWVCMGTLALMPALIVVVSMCTTHVFVDRYVLWAGIGIAWLIVALLCRAVRGNSLIGVVLLGILSAWVARGEIFLLCAHPFCERVSLCSVTWRRCRSARNASS